MTFKLHIKEWVDFHQIAQAGKNISWREPHARRDISTNRQGVFRYQHMVGSGAWDSHWNSEAGSWRNKWRGCVIGSLRCTFYHSRAFLLWMKRRLTSNWLKQNRGNSLFHKTEIQNWASGTAGFRVQRMSLELLLSSAFCCIGFIFRFHVETSRISSRNIPKTWPRVRWGRHSSPQAPNLRGHPKTQ